MNLAIFAYNFPHKKTQDFLLRLLIDGIKPCLVLAQDHIKLKIPQPTLRVRSRHVCLVHPRDICNRFGIKYYIVNHNSQDSHRILRQNKIDIAVISGARILEHSTIRSVDKGIINFHLGLIPQHRGLDGLQWSIDEEKPLGVTAHIIDKRIDAGYIIEKRIIEEFSDDSFVDLSLRIYETQLCMLSNVIERFSISSVNSFPKVTQGKVYKKMPPELEAKLPELLTQRLRRLNQ